MYFQNSPRNVAVICTLMLVLLSMLVGIDTADGADDDDSDEHGNVFSLCDRTYWYWALLHGPCWNSLIKLQATSTWIDITVIIGYALMLLCAVALLLYRNTKLFKKDLRESFYWKMIIIIAIVMIFMVSLKAYFFYQLYSTSARPEQANSISSQLSNSFQQYGHNEYITRAWQNTMLGGCCCGLHGYQDFTNIGVDVPPQCGCYDGDQQHYLYKGCTNGYIPGSFPLSTCTASPNSSFTNAGCLSFVVNKVDDTAKYGAVVHIAIVVVSAVVIILICDPIGNTLATIDDDGDSANQQIPQNRYKRKQKKKSTYSFKGSLTKKLVRMRLRARMIYSLKQ